MSAYFAKPVVSHKCTGSCTRSYCLKDSGQLKKKKVTFWEQNFLKVAPVWNLGYANTLPLGYFTSDKGSSKFREMQKT